MNTMQFFKPEVYSENLNTIFNLLSERMKRVLPNGDVEHIGSSAICGAISKGDLDILVRVSQPELEEAVQALQKIGFVIKSDTLRTESLCMLTTDEFAEDVAVQVISAGSSFENFVKFRDRLNADQKLVDQYNQLKISSTNLSPDEYRAKKSVFIKSVLDD